MVVALLDGLALHRHARPRATDRQVLTEALYALHRGFVEADAEAVARRRVESSTPPGRAAVPRAACSLLCDGFA